MSVRALLLVGLVACTDAAAPRTWCPTGEKCSPLAPEGLAFGVPGIVGDIRVPAKLAIGGTVQLTAEVQHTADDGMRLYTPLASPYTVTVDSPSIAVDQSSDAVTLRALANTGDRVPPGVDATVDFRDGDGLLLGRTDIETARIAKITSAVSTLEAYNRDGDPVFAPGGPVAIGLWDEADDALWDTSMTVSGAQSFTWDLIAAPTVTSTITVTAGDHAPVDLTIPVATAATITNFAGDSYVKYGSAYLCFEARSADGHQVYGADWQYTVDGMPVAATRIEPNCIHASEVSMRTTMTIVVSAAGATLTVMLPVI